MDRRQAVAALLFLPLLPAARAVHARDEPIIAGPCEGCEAVFAGRPHVPPAIARIAPAGEPGEPLSLRGTVRDAAGRAVAGVVIYAYHTDASGIYPDAPGQPRGAARSHGRLRGWARSDADGRYGFDTIRPGSYPGEDIPEHIHLHVIEPGRATYYIDDVVFRDDPKLTPAHLARHDAGRGGSGVATPRRLDGVWQVQRDIVLGLNLPGDALRSDR